MSSSRKASEAGAAFLIFRRRLRSGRVRFYRFDSGWRLRLLGAEAARFALESGAAELATQAPFTAKAEELHLWAVD